MAARQMTQTISVVVEGRIYYKKVTKKTTCGDVIQYLLRFSQLKEKEKKYFYLIASNDIAEQKLPNKAKIMKLSEDLMSESKRVQFILRKKCRFVPKVCIDKHSRLYHKSSCKDRKDDKGEPYSLSASLH
ncbi:hypothetical protein ACJMK2_021174 [Sinanodonta woodiana]|uniref:Ras-associating domain-containing protein n=1 Tax=Sinanodonta woodiana TaxID=1069815 RepID=A0ABD3U1T0_SINWO